jgi:uncharacterized damage-inducible protein DinB
MKIKSTELIADLIKSTKKLKQIAEEKFVPLSDSELNHKPNPNAWSIAQCLEHLNLYGDYYLEAMRNAMQKSNASSDTIFKSGLIGNYFANVMLPKEDDTVKKMEAPKPQNPTLRKDIQLSRKTVSRFISQQDEMLELLEIAQNKNLNKIRIPITIAKWMKLRLGDTFRFNVNHNIRHMKQAERVLGKEVLVL